MKIERIWGGLVSLGMAAALSVPAVLAKSQAAAQQGEMGMREKLQSAVESLNLTDDQKSKVKDIFADAKAKRQTVWSDSSLTDDQKKAWKDMTGEPFTGRIDLGGFGRRGKKKD